MSRKKNFTEPFEAPSAEEVQQACKRVGGKGEASRILRKNWNSIDRWCKGNAKIDFANWEILKNWGV